MTAPPPCADGPGDAGGERRAALLLAALRLSRDPALLPRLEAAVAALDDGRRPPAARRGERALLARLQTGVEGTLAPADAEAWEAERRAEAEAGAAEAWAARRGLSFGGQVEAARAIARRRRAAPRGPAG